ncbi:leucine-rich repeat-containing protein 15-like [Centruroides vittatus]|uniref:leucine-rich repeat-containing protein 15-like n=1 Tax=Centruroides vittatus TaxID=120091 RepID=UPI00350F0074
MRFVIFLQFLFVIVNSCEQFWKNWGNVSCTSSANCCHVSSKHSSVEIFNESILINCQQETIDTDFLRCLNVINVRNITFNDCYMSAMDFGIFTIGYKVENVKILYTKYERNFDSASFINLLSLKSVVIQSVRTSDLLHLIFINVPFLTYFQIKNYNFSLFLKRPFSNLINLSELYITNGLLKVLPEDLFYNLQNLTKLDLSNNHIESFPPSVFRNLTRLEYLYLSWNEIKDLPADMLKRLSNLKTFSMDRHKRLSEIPVGFFKGLHNLSVLSAWGCSFSALEEDVFFDFINLTAVDQDLNQFEHLPENLLKNNNMLILLSFSGNEITTLPRRIFHGLSNLRYITLLKNRLENLPEDVFLNLSSLQILILALNRLKHLPENIFFTLNNLLFLDISYNNITDISGKHPFGKSKHLRHLDVSNAGLTEWPMINWTEYNLTTVNFSNNHSETVNLPIYTPNKLTIDLSNCKIRTIYMDEWTYGF